MAALPGGAYCWAHAPELAEKRQAARAAGGRHRSNLARARRALPPRLAPIFDKLEAALGEVHEGKLAYQQASAMASIARALVALATAGELEQRVADLEARVKEEH